MEGLEPGLKPVGGLRPGLEPVGGLEPGLEPVGGWKDWNQDWTRTMGGLEPGLEPLGGLEPGLEPAGGLGPLGGSDITDQEFDFGMNIWTTRHIGPVGTSGPVSHTGLLVLGGISVS